MADKTLWNLNLLINNPSEENINALVKECEEENNNFVTKWKPRNDYLTDPYVMFEALSDLEKLNRKQGTLSPASYYYWLKLEIDKNNAEIKSAINKLTLKAVELENKIIFFTHKISRIKKRIQQIFLQSKVLEEFHFFLENLFKEGKYLLSEKEEKILAVKAKTSMYNWQEMIESLLSRESAKVLTDGKLVEKDFSSILSLITNEDQKTRDFAAKAFNSILKKHSDVAEIEINSILEDKLNNDILRKTKRPDEIRHLADGIDSDIVDTLIKTVKNKFDISKEYYKFKAEVLNKKYLEFHERNIPVGKLSKKITYNEAQKIVKIVFGKLSPVFEEIFARFSENGQIDVYPKKGKVSGAFCAHNLKNYPVYVLLNYTDTINDVLTLAHEMGHAIHFELAKQCNSLYYGASTATAEVASTFMEDFTLKELLNILPNKDSFTLLMHKLDDDISTIQRQVALYLFEKDLHKSFREKGYLSKKQIGEIFLDNLSSYLGPAVNLSKGAENWWIYISHIRNFFYVYSYASGALISKSIQTKYKKNELKIESYINFLQKGESQSIKNLFENLELNITQKEFWLEGLDNISEILNRVKSLKGAN